MIPSEMLIEESICSDKHNNEIRVLMKSHQYCNPFYHNIDIIII